MMRKGRSMTSLVMLSSSSRLLDLKDSGLLILGLILGILPRLTSGIYLTSSLAEAANLALQEEAEAEEQQEALI